jgi:hypothetical protein
MSSASADAASGSPGLGERRRTPAEPVPISADSTAYSAAVTLRTTRCCANVSKKKSSTHGPRWKLARFGEKSVRARAAISSSAKASVLSA